MIDLSSYSSDHIAIRYYYLANLESCFVMSITSSRSLPIDRYQGVTTLIENEQKYEKIIDSLGSDSNSRKYLKGLRKKLLNQTEDKIIGTILSEAVHTAVVSGPIALRFLVELLHQHNISL